MSEKKQIEEIRKDIFAAFGGYAKWEEDWQSLAEAVYNAGYRKQSEAEWTYGENNTMKCTLCRRRMPKIILARFCPNCGAKMKGGAE